MAETQTRRMVPRWVLDIQNFLLRHNLLGPAGNILMVITTIGRKSGKNYHVPIGYVPDGTTYLSFNPQGWSNWYKNVLVNPQATLNIKGKTIRVRGEPIRDDAEFLKAMEVFKRERPNQLERFMKIPQDSAGADLLKAKDQVVLVRFYPL
ncbi:MAG TPA: nitroreductase/quinone reductase family protein [Phototrophicaceae bacterium]|jgi:deazaflavin-dependent oxidoreductase (nitroreductase family)|nr:nitroreductase/quinone reductase family protein [Phototrophicaceae bacterium]